MRIFALLSLLLPFWSNSVFAMELGQPERILEQFLRASYARDSDVAWQYVSSADQQTKPLSTYRSENGAYDDFALVLARELASYIELESVVVNLAGDRATVRFDATLPDANHVSLRPIVQGFDSATLSVLDATERQARLQQLRRLAADRQLPMLQSEGEEWDLVFEDNRWRVFRNWAEAIEVLFEGYVSSSLDWEFVPTQSRVFAQPGQTVQMSYIARNIGDAESTGKARHIIGASEVAEHLQIVSCFCFLEQSLAAGETVELPLVFRVDYEVPDQVDRFTVNYEFFEIAEFPPAGSS